MTPETLRGKVVLLVVGGIIGLSVLLYTLIGVLLVLHVLKTGSLAGSQVPGELWLGAGVLAGSLTTLLANSKMGQDSLSTPQPVVTAPGESLAVHESESPPVQDPNAKPWQLDDQPTTEVPVVRSRRGRHLEDGPRNQGDY